MPSPRPAAHCQATKATGRGDAADAARPGVMMRRRGGGSSAAASLASLSLALGLLLLGGVRFCAATEHPRDAALPVDASQWDAPNAFESLESRSSHEATTATATTTINPQHQVVHDRRLKGTKKKQQPPWPYPPYVDSCSGMLNPVCLSTPRCSWYTMAIPWCYDTIYHSKVPPEQLHPQQDYAKLFFEYNYGIHMAEGTNQKMFYNTDHIECARLCVNSTNEGLVRCLSFDFYEFSDFALPQEAAGRGMCVLNTANQDDARLRNIDQGYTDAELFSHPPTAGHYRLRTSNVEGFYNVRNPRGGQIASQLDYPNIAEDQNQIIIWGQSRWGISHKPGSDTGKRLFDFACKGGAVATPIPAGKSPQDVPLVYEGGYTPVNEDQQCPGLVTKQEAMDLCEGTGGSLCPDQATVVAFEGRKIGCSFDGWPMWSASDPNPNPNAKKFVRCCAKYKPVDSCAQLYSTSNIDFCSQYTTFPDCVKYASGYSRQANWGFGRQLDQFRKQCTDPNGCTQLLVQDWKARDQCVWCLQPGTGAGVCRAGNDFGVCQGTAYDTQVRFAAHVNRVCGAQTTCTLVEAYPDLCQLLLGSTSRCLDYNPNLGLPVDCTTIKTQTKCVAVASCLWDTNQNACVFNPDVLGVF